MKQTPSGTVSFPPPRLRSSGFGSPPLPFLTSIAPALPSYPPSFDLLGLNGICLFDPNGSNRGSLFDPTGRNRRIREDKGQKDRCQCRGEEGRGGGEGEERFLLLPGGGGVVNVVVVVINVVGCRDLGGGGRGRSGFSGSRRTPFSMTLDEDGRRCRGCRSTPPPPPLPPPYKRLEGRPLGEGEREIELD